MNTIQKIQTKIKEAHELIFDNYNKETIRNNDGDEYLLMSGDGSYILMEYNRHAENYIIINTYKSLQALPQWIHEAIVRSYNETVVYEEDDEPRWAYDPDYAGELAEEQHFNNENN